jgi:hypothetical protein
LASPVGAPPAGDFHVAEEDRPIRYRYATTAIVGPWRPTEAEARNDAMRAALAVAEDGDLVWRVPGRIETGDTLPISRVVAHPQPGVPPRHEAACHQDQDPEP